jgi:hypothetical protein
LAARIARIEIDGVVGAASTKWKLTMTNGEVVELTNVDVVVISTSIKTFHNETHLDVVPTAETLTAAARSDLTGTSSYAFALRCYGAHYIVLQPNNGECKNLASFHESRIPRRATLYLGNALLPFAFKSFSAALKAVITTIYRLREPPNMTVVSQSNRLHARFVSGDGALLELDNNDTTEMLPPLEKEPKIRKPKAPTNKRRRELLVGVIETPPSKTTTPKATCARRSTKSVSRQVRGRGVEERKQRGKKNNAFFFSLRRVKSLKRLQRKCRRITLLSAALSVSRRPRM